MTVSTPHATRPNGTAGSSGCSRSRRPVLWSLAPGSAAASRPRPRAAAPVECGPGPRGEPGLRVHRYPASAAGSSPLAAVRRSGRGRDASHPGLFDRQPDGSGDRSDDFFAATVAWRRDRAAAGSRKPVHPARSAAASAVTRRSSSTAAAPCSTEWDGTSPPTEFNASSTRPDYPEASFAPPGESRIRRSSTARWPRWRPWIGPASRSSP